LQNRKIFLPSPRSQNSRSPSPGGLMLDDIRLAVINGNLDYFQSSVERDSGFFIDTILKSGWTALMYASSCGHPHIVHYCLEKGADPNYHRGKLLDSFLIEAILI